MNVARELPKRGHSGLAVDGLAELICQTRAGESGSWFGIAPNEPKALATALAIRPPIGMIAPSPAPLTPSGLLGDGWFSSAIARILEQDSKRLNQRGDSLI